LFASPLTGIQQLSSQRAELVRETGAIFARLGRLGAVHDYCSIGDGGKTVLAFQHAFGMRGNSYVVNDKEGNEVPCVLRGNIRLTPPPHLRLASASLISTAQRHLRKVPPGSGREIRPV
jgi:hypothetical protein